MKVKSKYILLAVLSAFMFLTVAGTASASHFRGGIIKWERDTSLGAPPNTVNIHVVWGWRTDINNGLDFGDGDFLLGLGASVATFADLSGEAYGVFEKNITHTYSGPGPWTVKISNCCRIISLVNAGGDFFNVETVIDLNGSNMGGSSSSIPFILQWPQGPQTLSLFPVDPDGAVTCRMATALESSIPTVATAGAETLAVSPACVLSWDTTAAADLSKYAAQVIMTDPDGLTTALDFIIEVSSGFAGNTPPGCELNGLATNTTVVGSPFTISATGTDPDAGDMLTHDFLGLSLGATITPLNGAPSAAPPLTATFAWTPAAAGSISGTFVFADDLGQQALCIFNVTAVEMLPPPPNAPPVAVASGPVMVSVGIGVTLDGSASSDPDGDTLTFAWTQTAGTSVTTLADAATAAPSFTAPAVLADETLTFKLTVTDPGSLSSMDTVSILVKHANGPPVADAGVDAMVFEGDPIALDGSFSSDPDGDTLTFAWTQIAGTSSVTLADAATAAPSFTAPAVPADETLTFKLTVTDPAGATSMDTVDILVKGLVLELELDKGRAEKRKDRNNLDLVRLRGDFWLDQVRPSDPIIIDSTPLFDPLTGLPVLDPITGLQIIVRSIGVDITASFDGMWLETIPAGSLVENPLIPNLYEFESVASGPRIAEIEIIYVAGALHGEFDIRWKGVSLMGAKEAALDASDPKGSDIPIPATMSIGNNDGEVLVGFELKDNKNNQKKWRFKNR